jgi:hypothetical protein
MVTEGPFAPTPRRNGMPADLPQKLVTAFRTLAGGSSSRKPVRRTAIKAAEVEQIVRPRRLPMRPELAAAEARVSAMTRHLRVTEQDIVWCLGQGRWHDAAVVIARLSGEPPELVMRGFETDDVGQALPVMRLADLSWAVVEKVLDRRGLLADDAARAVASASYEKLGREAAARAWGATKLQLNLTAMRGA